ncbi:hypothetical protein OEB94_28370 [Streptomyces sp. ICN988]|uniref:hypothetical protein n=1 Tax=Streptomyces TaxID=1883 RepID=UPI001591CCE8|nr:MULTISPECIES: hypothetical protein [Streptomyces]MBH5134793.1 hypothetical protein [Streptomyces sp. HB-N217]MCV2463189.1 hypothetical protein [Streptomyces sp. ICN988]QKW62893.1 hypothetical protein HUT15_21530 [Streptomyces sp. NA03103]WSU03243.1 hypothetical protein OG368_22700 [Streptomyces sp. NBC_01124]
MGMKTKIALGAVVGIAVIGAMSANSGDGDGDGGGKSDGRTSASAGEKSGDGAKADGGKADGASDAKPAEDKAVEKASQAEQFKAFVQKNGSPNEKDAVSHVTKVQGADEQNDILDAADVYTDFTGGIMGEGTGPAKLIASAFADWKDSENGLVTIYDAEGELLGNGQF